MRHTARLLILAVIVSMAFAVPAGAAGNGGKTDSLSPSKPTVDTSSALVQLNGEPLATYSNSPSNRSISCLRSLSLARTATVLIPVASQPAAVMLHTMMASAWVLSRYNHTPMSATPMKTGEVHIGAVFISMTCRESMNAVFRSCERASAGPGMACLDHSR